MDNLKVEVKVVSPRFSFKGWNFLEWFKGNWKTIKEVAKVLGPWILSQQFFQDNVFYAGLLTLVGKFLLDVGEYWVKEKTS